MGTFRSDDHHDQPPRAGHARDRDAPDAVSCSDGVIPAAETEAQADLAWERFAARVRSGALD